MKISKRSHKSSFYSTNTLKFQQEKKVKTLLKLLHSVGIGRFLSCQPLFLVNILKKIKVLIKKHNLNGSNDKL